MTNIHTLDTLLKDHEISDFSRRWVETSNTNEEKMRCAYESLKRIGLTDEKIASQAHLLGMNPETIERNYQHHIGLLRQDYEDRNSGRELLMSQPQLLGIPSETINANVYYLHSLGIDYHNAFLLGTTSQLKRKKMAWLLREVFDYRDIPESKKRETIQKMYGCIRENPQYLVKSISALERAKDNIKQRISE